MKIFLSADMEGITGTTKWSECDHAHGDYHQFQEQMTAEVAAACEGALEVGATEVWVRDAHETACNIIAARLPEQTRLMRNWSGHPYSMMDGIDSSFDAALMIGYHARAGSDTNPLRHTLALKVMYIKINDRFASEFMVNTYTAALEEVPVVFVSGDAGLCADAADLVPNLVTLPVKEGIGSATINIHPETAIRKTRESVASALENDPERCRLALPEHFKIEIGYKEHVEAYKGSFYPGASLLDNVTLNYETDDYFDALRLFAFVL